MRHFRKLHIWQNGIQRVKDIYKIATELPIEEKYGLRRQITRAAVSVPSNIAEGSSQNSDIEYNRF
jgi:four helix bundle protein